MSINLIVFGLLVIIVFLLIRAVIHHEDERLELPDYLEYDEDNGIRIRNCDVELDDVIKEFSEGKTVYEIQDKYPEIDLDVLVRVIIFCYNNKQFVSYYLESKT